MMRSEKGILNEGGRERSCIMKKKKIMKKEKYQVLLRKL
jgi:hypothetical protein